MQQNFKLKHLLIIPLEINIVIINNNYFKTIRKLNFLVNKYYVICYIFPFDTV